MECEKCKNKEFIVKSVSLVLAEADEKQEGVLELYRVIKTGEEKVNCSKCNKILPMKKIKKFTHDFGY